MDIISKKNAKEKGLSYYYTGRPCKHGHVTKRCVHSTQCWTCRQRVAKALRVKTNFAHSKKWYQKNKEQFAIYTAGWREERAEYIKAQSKAYRQSPRGKLRRQVYESSRRARLLCATPPWADLEAIERIYAEAIYLTETTGVAHEVDHYFPLKGKTCCGLHIAENLRVVPATVNRKKGCSVPTQ